ncbi:MAG TPA: dynein regulation protein LC7, partial [Asanoa sp.]|nr:dynein regulation protein LC7 [Asanoa sp.]
MTSPYIHESIERPDADVSNGQLSQEAQTFNWLLDSFTSGTAGVVEAIAVS